MINTIMRINEIIVEHSDFGITGSKKAELSDFFSDTIKSTLIDMNVQGEDRIATYSLAKRLSGTLIPNMFHLRNAIKGKDKYFENRFYKLILPYVQGAIRSVSADHPDTTKVFLNNKFVDEFVYNLINQKELLKKRFF